MRPRAKTIKPSGCCWRNIRHLTDYGNVRRFVFLVVHLIWSAGRIFLNSQILDDVQLYDGRISFIAQLRW